MNNREIIKELKKLEAKMEKSEPEGWIICSHHFTGDELSVWKEQWRNGEEIESISFNSDAELVKAHVNRTPEDIEEARQVLAEWLEAE